MTAAAYDPWTRRLTRLDPRLDRHVGEMVRVVPQGAGGDFAPAGADAARPAFEVVGVLSIGRGETDMGGNAAHLRNAQIRTADAELSIRRALLPAGADLRKGDRIVALATGLTYEIDRVDPEHEGRIPFRLVIVGGDA